MNTNRAPELQAEVTPGGALDLPVYVNPQALTTVEELRSALDRTNLELARQFNLSHGLKDALTAMANDLAPIVLAHMAGDSDGLDLALLRLIKQHVRVMPGAQSAAGVH
jgi:hypothetical protein